MILCQKLMQMKQVLNKKNQNFAKKWENLFPIFFVRNRFQEILKKLKHVKWILKKRIMGFLLGFLSFSLNFALKTALSTLLYLSISIFYYIDQYISIIISMFKLFLEKSYQNCNFKFEVQQYGNLC